MKKILVSLSLIVMASCLFSTNIVADEYGTDKVYHVSFDGTKLYSSDYSREEIKPILQGMQPGDKAEINFELTNNYSKAVDWWMSNDTIKTFEEDKRNTVEGGNYTYKLIYKDTSGVEKELYNSDDVGGRGEGSNGLQDATNALDDLFLLETIDAGQKSYLTMSFELDGETQSNNYQDVLGTLMVNFAVELDNPGKHEPGTKYEEVYDEVPSEKSKESSKSGKKTTRTVIYLPYTGDSFNPVPYICLEVGLFVILVGLFISYRRYSKKQGGR